MGREVKYSSLKRWGRDTKEWYLEKRFGRRIYEQVELVTIRGLGDDARVKLIKTGLICRYLRKILVSTRLVWNSVRYFVHEVRW